MEAAEARDSTGVGGNWQGERRQAVARGVWGSRGGGERNDLNCWLSILWSKKKNTEISII